MEKINTLSKTVVFITGAFLGNNCWDDWKNYFESKGYKTLAPPWPYKDASPEDLRNRDLDSEIASIRLDHLMYYYAGFVNTLPVRPILVGHSLGGLIVQLLLQRGLGSAGVAIHSLPASGSGKFSLSFIKDWWDAIGVFSPMGKTYLVPFKKWKTDFTNGMTCEVQKLLYYKYAVPESRLLIRDLLTRKARIYYGHPHVPLLLTSGSMDRLSSPARNKRNYRRYDTGRFPADHKEFKGQNHLVFSNTRWMDIADYILAWLQGLNN